MSPGSFGKPGRPREDRLLRRREIFLSVAPIILAEGAAAVTMRRAAAAASLSVGGIHHYFPDRRSLLVYGAQPEAMARLCSDFFTSQPPYTTLHDPWRVVLAFIEFQRHEAALVRPALRAALELGVDDLDRVVEAGVHRGTEELTSALRRVLPASEELDLERLGLAIRRLVLGSVLDRAGSDEEMLDALRSLLAGALLRHRPRSEQAHASEPAVPR